MIASLWSKFSTDQDQAFGIRGPALPLRLLQPEALREFNAAATRHCAAFQHFAYPEKMLPLLPNLQIPGTPCV